MTGPAHSDRPRVIDAHVHIIPETALGSRSEPLGTEQSAYGFRTTHDGAFYAVPPFVHDSQFTADTLVKMMDVYGVDFAVIQQTPLWPLNEEIARAVEAYPDRLAGAMLLDPADGWQDEMEYWYARGLRSVKFEMRSVTCGLMHPDLRYDSPVMTEMFAKAGAMGMTVTIDPAPADFPIYTPETLRRAVEALPGTRFVICHLGFPVPIGTEKLRAKWEAMAGIAALPNCWLDVSAMPDFFDEEGWPFPTALELLREVKRTVGAEKLIWGSDIPGTLNRATYPQMMEMFRRAGLTADELDGLFYANASTAYGLNL
ncbi:MAG: amidohydrolase [Lachnospiraceae bacterium]|nr:amidohydrolase [Lachnospiraceae bacterium]